jgi:ketosteroid isomerase-like protein
MRIEVHGVAAAILGIERTALDRWGRGDPGGYLDVSADDLTYFDPFVPRRVDGRDALRAHYAPVAGTIRVDRYEILNPAVEAIGDVAWLTFNLVNYVTDAGVERETSRWNSTEIYRRDGHGWVVVHSHWSLTTPAVQPIG